VQVIPDPQMVETAVRALRQQKHLIIVLQRGVVTKSAITKFYSAIAPFSTAGFLITGGDTATLVCEALGVQGIDLKGEILPGLPWGVAVGGVIDGLPIATKSGGFGGPDALLRVAQFFNCKGKV
jgi:uncharacterized protein YgbK (DUF1537 family)